MKHTISILVDNKPGVLSRVAGLFSGRGFNIECLSVAETLDPAVSRITLVTSGDDQIIEQIIKQLYKLINVSKVIDFSNNDHVEREMVLLKVVANESSRAEILRIVDIFRSKIVDVSPNTYTLEVTGDEEKIDAIVDLLRPFGIKEVVKTGKIENAREDKNLKKKTKNKGHNS